MIINVNLLIRCFKKKKLRVVGQQFELIQIISFIYNFHIFLKKNHA